MREALRRRWWVGVLSAAALAALIGLTQWTGTSPLATQPPPSASYDLSERLDAFRGSDGALDEARVAAAFTRLEPQLAGLRFVLVRGFLTKFLEPLQALDLSDYLEAQDAALREVGFHVEQASINTLDSAAANAGRLRSIVERDARPVCFITHSKGGVDVLTLLLTAPRAMRDRVACWVALQPPFLGSPVADEVSRKQPLQFASHGLLDLFGGSEQSLEDLRTESRLAFLDDHRAELASVTDGMPIVTATAWTDREATPCIRFRPIYSTLAWMRSLDLRNDGLVPSISTTLPGTPFVVLTGIDHTGAVAKAGCAALPFEQRKLLTRALLALAFEARGV